MGSNPVADFLTLEETMKLILSVDVQEIKDGYAFTMHHAKKATTYKVMTLDAGFKKVMEIVEKFNEVK